MKRQETLSIFLCCALACTSLAPVHAQDATASAEPKSSSMQSLESDHEMYNHVYAPTPSLLKLWDREEYSTVQLGYDIEKLDFHSYTSPESTRQLTLESEAILSLEGGWRFFGRFQYLNGSADETGYNLHLGRPDNGSPVHYFTPHPGDWNTQKYVFQAAASKTLGEKWSIGATIDYIGDLRFRTVDMRNDITELKLRIGPSVSYAVNEKQHVSFGYIFNRRKGEPSISNKYPHQSDGIEYNVYINTGLGSYFKNAEQQTDWLDMQHEVTLGWDCRKDNAMLNANYTFATGEELWERKSYSTQGNSDEKLTKHTYMKHMVNATYVKFLESGNRWETFADFTYLTGETSMSETSVYTPSFEVTQAAANAQSAYFWKSHPWLQNAKLNLNWSMYEGTDQKYAQVYNINNLDTEASLCLGRPVGGDDRLLSLTVAAGYKMNLSYDHQTKAATSNLVTQNMVYSQLAYDAASLLHGGISLDYRIPMNKYTLQCGVNYNYVEALATDQLDPKGTALEQSNNQTYSARVLFIF